MGIRLSTPTYSQLEQMAYKIYKRPVAVFFPSVPKEPSPKTDLELYWDNYRYTSRILLNYIESLKCIR